MSVLIDRVYNFLVDGKEASLIRLGNDVIWDKSIPISKTEISRSSYVREPDYGVTTVLTIDSFRVDEIVNLTVTVYGSVHNDSYNVKIKTPVSPSAASYKITWNGQTNIVAANTIFISGSVPISSGIYRTLSIRLERV